MKTSKADIVREYGPFPEAEQIHGVSFDGAHVWFASGNGLNVFDPDSGKRLRTLDVAGHAGTASRRSIRKPGACSDRSRRPAAAPIPVSPGPKARSGWANTGSGRFIRS